MCISPSNQQQSCHFDATKFTRYILLYLIATYIYPPAVFSQCDTLPLAHRWESTSSDFSYVNFRPAIFDQSPPIIEPSPQPDIRGNTEHLSVISYHNGNPKFIFNGHQLRRGDDYELLANGVAVGADSVGNSPRLGLSVYQHMMLPMPGDTNLICLFHCEATRTPANPADSAWENNIPAFFSVYDARLDAFVLRDSVLHSRATEGWTAIRHPDGQSWWVATRVHSPSGIRVYKLTSQGIQADVLSIGGAEFGWRDAEDATGIAFSPSGLHLGWAVRASSRHDTIPGEHWIMDFDCQIGQASHAIKVDGNLFPAGGSSVAFSPQGQYFYGIKDDSTGFRFEHDIHRYRVDLSGGHQHGSAEHIFNSERNRGVALGPDGRIYGGPNSALKYIEHPDRWQALTDASTTSYDGGAVCINMPPDPWVPQGLNPQQRIIDLPLLRMPRLGGDNFVSCGDTSQYFILENCYQELTQVSYQLGPGITLVEDSKPELRLAFDTMVGLPPQRYIALANDHPCRMYRDTFWVYVDACANCIPTTTSEQVVACDSALVHGEWVTDSGDYLQLFQSLDGCDSTSTVDLTINASQNISSTLVACDSALVHGVWEYTSGEYTETFQSFTSCDSTSVIELTINESIQTAVSLTACDSIQIGGVWITENGDYPTLFATSAGCDSSHVVTVSLQTTPPQINLPRDTTLATLDLLAINVDSLAQFPFQWTPPSAVDCEDCASVEVVAGFAGRLQVDIGEDPCISRTMLNIERQNNTVDVFSAPDAFSPNGDGINDFFEIALPTGAELLSFEIYNRWGSQVYVSNCPCASNRFGLTQTWDGTERGTAVNPGVFAYVGQIRFADGREEIVEGSFAVVR
jgi:gliding motility-associated-like protein